MAYALGIDLGTTFTAAAVSAREGRTEVVSLGNHAVTIPSMVFLRDDGEVIVGDVALRRGQQEPDRLAREFKRRFGDATPIMLGHTPYSAERLMAAVLQQVVAQVSERHGGPPDAIAVAHPANWGPYKIELFQQAAQLAGLGGARLVTEPEAAAVHFAAGERLEVGDIVAVYDLGGGTFDAAVLRRTTDGFETLGEPQGIERLGGIDFDEAVLSHVRATLGDALTGIDPADPATRSAMNRLRDECVSAKEALSEDSETSIPVMLPGLQTQVRLTRSELEDALRPALRETLASLRRAIEAASVTPGDLKAVVLAGGSSRIPLVKELVSELGRPVALDAHPKHTVALGAARVRPGIAAASATGVPAPSAPPQPVPAFGAAPPAPPTPPGPPSDPPAAGPTPPAGGSEPTEPVPTTPVATTSEASTTGATPPPPKAPRRTDPAAGGGDGGGSDGPSAPSKQFLIAAGVGLLVAIIVAFVLIGGGDGGGGDDGGDGGVASDSTTTTEADGLPACESSSGRCVFITSIEEQSDGEFVIGYEPTGFEPAIEGADTDHHIHFFYDTVSLEDAGALARGPWEVWDHDPEGRYLYYGELGMRRSEIPDGATKACAAVAKHSHELDDDPQLSCIDLP